MSGVTVIMAGALQRDLMARGVRHLDFDACEQLVAGMLRSIMTIERGTDLPRACETELLASDGSCEACGAFPGEACRAPR
jgi:hypothetical protein